MDYPTATDNGFAAVVRCVQSVKEQWHSRDASAERLRAVLAGDWERVAPGAFTEDYPAPMVANRIEVMSRDVAASLAALPTITCAAPSSMSESAKKFGDNRSKIASGGYVEGSNLEPHMTDFGRSFDCFGMGVFFIEPDMKAKMPRIRVRDGSTVYVNWDTLGRTIRGFEEFSLPAHQIKDMVPEAVDVHRALDEYRLNDINVVRYSDGKQTVVYLPDCKNTILLQYKAPIPGESQFVGVPRPKGGSSFSGVPRGAYDDLVYLLVADHEFRMLALEAASKAVQGPLAVPMDVTDVSYGPDAVIRTNQPQNIHRVGTDFPQAAMAAGEMIRQDLAVGGMSPESRTGNIQASVITGKGIEAASAGYSAQIANAQIAFTFGLREAIRKCFIMDENLWPKVEKEIRGVSQGVPYTLKYTPAKDIKGDHTVDISYGFLSGMAPNNALVFVLQAQAAGLVSRDFAARQLPVGMNVSDEFHKIDLETIRNSLMQGISALSQGIPAMVQGGQDPTPIIAGISKIAAGIKKGKQLEDLVAEVFAPEPPPTPAAPGSDALDTGAPGEAGGGGLSGSLAPGLATEGANARPDLQQFMAGLGRNGDAQLTGGVSRMNPVQGQ